MGKLSQGGCSGDAQRRLGFRHLVDQAEVRREGRFSGFSQAQCITVHGAELTVDSELQVWPWLCPRGYVESGSPLQNMGWVVGGLVGQ